MMNIEDRTSNVSQPTRRAAWSGPARSLIPRSVLSPWIVLSIAAVSWVGCTPAGSQVGGGVAPAPAPAPTIQIPPPADGPAEVRLICVAPSPYTHRHDSLRAGFGIFLSLRALAEKHDLPLVVRYYDGSEFYEDTQRIRRVLGDARVLVVGGSTWSQGPAYLLRRFFERAGDVYLAGVSASAWATAGGAHTGGQEVVESVMRSLMGMGAQTFTMGQKYMVFSTDERLQPTTPGAFSLLDVWYMDHFARAIAVVALAGDDREQARALSEALGVSAFYYMGEFPPSPTTLESYRPLQERLNAASKEDSQAYRELRALLSDPDCQGDAC